MFPIVSVACFGVADGKIGIKSSIAKYQGTFITKRDVVGIQYGIYNGFGFGSYKVAGAAFA